jgi:hypothetical protein
MIHFFYNNIKKYINQLIIFYSKSVTNKKQISMPQGFTDWDYLIELHIR